MLILVIYAGIGWLISFSANKLWFDKKPVKNSSLIIALTPIIVALISFCIMTGMSPTTAGSRVGVFVIVLYSFINKAEKESHTDSSQ